MTATPSEQTPPTQPPAQPQPSATPPPAAPETGKQPPWGSDENFDPAKAWDLIQNLRKEGADPTLRAELDAMKTAQVEQQQRLATALGIKPEEISDADKLSQEVADLKQQFAQTQRQAAVLTAAQNNNIPPQFQGWLTADTAEGLDAQAKQLAPMVQATLAAQGLTPLAGQPSTPTTPTFVPNPGQGQGAGAPTAEQQSAAGYAEYYDPATGRPRF